jgi:hypothetical protein
VRFRYDKKRRGTSQDVGFRRVIEFDQGKINPEGGTKVSAKRKNKKRLGEILVGSNIISGENLERALDLQRSEGGLLGEILSV